ncbi:hypothetical protein CSKR_104880 [Clonorchis sinensis]|uniref:Uncharacterized protein n=1 Tax=Clonorchis sinensis TaxID=79923 RepID=A0A419PXS3_CLOSI|nr:hypothetical protein CSKR_104880 [Clonorchis sinensis]
MIQLEHETAWCSIFSCLETSQTEDSAVFQVSLSQNQLDLQNIRLTETRGLRLLMNPKKGETGRGLSKNFQQPYE